MDNKAILNVANELKIKESQVLEVLGMLAQGDTVPFISRYRKDKTGGLDEEQIYQIETLFKYTSELNKRKEGILQILDEKKLLTPELKLKIENTKTKSELEAIYEPFKVGKVTKASEAIKLGLEPLALSILNNTKRDFDPKVEAKKYLNDQVTSVEFALEQANYIIAQIISQNVEIRSAIKENIENYAVLVSKAKKIELDEEQKFTNYYDYKIPLKYIKNHNVLAINRGVNLNILKLSFNYKVDFLKIIILKQIDKKRLNAKFLDLAIDDSLKRLILPSLEREIFNDLFEKAEASAIKIFSNSVEKLLMAPAIKNHNVLAIDPAFVNGCKLAALNENGDLLEINKIFPNAPRFQIEQASKIVLAMLKKHKIDIVVIGNGTASRETEQFIAKLIKENDLKIKYAIVSEVGASVYSASKLAIEEFPNLNVEERSAINIGRKFLDPLNELIKIDPKSIGVGQYQHDLNQKELNHYLNFKVDKVVNLTGIDLNSASKTILTHISGLSSKVAENIILYRNEIGKFNNREQLKKVKGLGAKTYEQAIGFLRIFDSNNFLDRTFVHPESYELANKIIQDYNLEPNNEGLSNLKLEVQELADKYHANYYEVDLILNALKNPVKNFDQNKKGFILKDNILNIQDLKVGDQIQGTIENITDFGVFVYIGLKQNLFIHTSKLGLSENESAFEKYHPGQIIDAKLLEINLEKNRISGEII
ncbi:helix-hairpin-helix domain-containing protein [Mycoplasmopsis glycophila]|uniref:RNA (S1 domain)-binding protein n=1 Tax=Mycoplasmopsis glycophila TaxID=171285 RepID=A0A449AWA2_9BACT|nr:Tex-like N-terminal domain-containing protein [Mycoplasmopsis glycophila]VEU71035.1 RNA (S1 domain)-binding protein [Mycoplasmopsis glycophila]